MRPRSPRFRRRVAAALLPLLTAASAGALAAQAASNNPNDNNQDIADLAISKTVSASHVESGQQVTYTLIVTNNGPRPGTQVRIHDGLPSGASVSSATVTEKSSPSDDCAVSTDHRSVDCTIHGEINPTAPQQPQTGHPRVVVEVVATVTGVFGHQVCNNASVTGNHRDPDPSNNAASACTTIDPWSLVHSDLSITKAAQPQTVSVGGLVTYALTVANGGPDRSSIPTVTDVLPSGLTFVSATPSQTMASCSDGSSVSCTLEPIAPAGSATVTITARPTVAVAGSEVENCASVFAANDTNDDNDEGCATITVRPQADLSITKTADKAVALIGEELTYTVTVTNNGPNTATHVVVTDDIPAQATLVSAAPAAACPQVDPVVCTFPSLTSGSSIVVTIKVKPTVKGLEVVNTATVKADQDDPTAPNSASAKTAYVALVPSGAFGESVDVRVLRRIKVTSGPLASVTLPAGGGGPFNDSAANVRVTDGLFGDLLRLDLLAASTAGGRTPAGDIFVASSADVAKASLVNGLITVEGLHSDCLATTAGDGRSSANVVNLRIAGVLVKVEAGPNSTVTVPGVGTLILDEQISTGAGLNQSRSVNALHLKLDGLLAKGDVILAHSDCGIDP